MSNSGNLAKLTLLDSLNPYFCYVTDLGSRAFTSEGRQFLEMMLRSGVDLIQLREKQLPDRDACELLSWILDRRKGRNTAILLNTRFDIAVAVGADGVHLASRSVPICEVRRRVGDSFLIGKSIHTLSEAVQASQEGADYLFFGPVFETPSKGKWGAPQGLDRLEEVCKSARIPVFAIGGMRADNALSAVARGARGIAAIGFFQGTDRPDLRVNELAQAVGRSGG